LLARDSAGQIFTQAPPLSYAKHAPPGGQHLNHTDYLYQRIGLIGVMGGAGPLRQVVQQPLMDLTKLWRLHNAVGEI